MANVNHTSTDNQPTRLIDQHSSAVVIGLGATGYSMVRYLCARGLQVHVADTRSEPPYLSQMQDDYPQVTYQLGDFEDDAFERAKLLVISPGVALKQAAFRNAKQAGAVIVGDIELFVQENQQPILAITGSNGKSTVTTLVGDMCRAAAMTPFVAGNIGIPVLDGLTDQLEYDVAVLELSSFQLETTNKVNALSAVILNVSADHMDRYDSMGDYLLAKARILRGAQHIVLPRHDEQLKQITVIDKQTLSFDLDEPTSPNQFGVKRLSNERWLVKGEERLIRLRDIALTGLHNVNNVLSAYALLDSLQLPKDALNGAIKAFTGLPHRMQTIAEFNQVVWVNDSKATNIGATSTALLGLEKDVVWIAGGQGKDADFTQLRDAIRANIKHLIVFGEDASLIESALSTSLPTDHVATLADAVALAANYATAESVVLFSPACASFDQYQNYQQRGDDFVAQVTKQLKPKITGGHA